MTVYSPEVRAQYTAMIAHLGVAASAKAVQARMAAQSAAIAERYPLADGELSPSERIDADTRTLAAALRERAVRQFVTE